MKARVQTLKEVATILGVSLQQVNKLRAKLIEIHGCPEYMIHGTNGFKWNIQAFKSVI
jgi:hypothetical protein